MKDNVSTKIMKSMLKENQSKPNEPGICPVCGKPLFYYDAFEMSDNEGCYPWRCHHCKATGEEWYRLEFIEHVVN